MKEYSIINDPQANRQERLQALGEAELPKLIKTGEVNNHIHTIYSFSPYTPSMAALQARNAGLEAAGSVDHDSIAGAEEMLAACDILGIGGCTGFEVRVSFKDTAEGAFKERKLNNPDSPGLAYMTVQGIPKPALPQVTQFLEPLRSARLLRTRNMTENANALLAEAGLEPIDFQRDILDRSQYAEGGGITERHLLAAMGDTLIQKYGKGAALIEGLETAFGVQLPPKIALVFRDPCNPHYLFDILGVLKAHVLSRIFIQPTDQECIPAQRVIDFALSIGAIPAYAYLGDVEESPTGDKRAERFEDAYLESLFEELSCLGYRAVTYMPPRNTPAQLRRIQRLCREGGFMEISGVDINSSRQSFLCPEVLQRDFRHLIDTTWALILHERLASLDPSWSLFSPKNPLAASPLATRLSIYGNLGKALDLKNLEQAVFKTAQTLQEGSI